MLEITVEVQHQDGDQHQHAAEQRVEKELDRRIFTPWSAPDADQEVHRQQHDFPEDVEQEEVEGQKDADHASFQQQKQHTVGLHMLGDRGGGAGRHGQQADKGGQDDQWQADAVDPHEIIDVKGRDPGHTECGLHVSQVGVETGVARGKQEY